MLKLLKKIAIRAINLSALSLLFLQPRHIAGKTREDFQLSPRKNILDKLARTACLRHGSLAYKEAEVHCIKVYPEERTACSSSIIARLQRIRSQR